MRTVSQNISILLNNLNDWNVLKCVGFYNKARQYNSLCIVPWLYCIGESSTLQLNQSFVRIPTVALVFVTWFSIPLRFLVIWKSLFSFVHRTDTSFPVRECRIQSAEVLCTSRGWVILARSRDERVATIYKLTGARGQILGLLIAATRADRGTETSKCV